MVPLAKVILSDMGTSILFSYMKQFDEINYIYTQNIVPLVDLWFEVEQDFLLKMYSSNVIKQDGTWDFLSKKSHGKNGMIF